jgi:hypothetical protein
MEKHGSYEFSASFGTQCVTVTESIFLQVIVYIRVFSLIPSCTQTSSNNTGDRLYIILLMNPCILANCGRCVYRCLKVDDRWEGKVVASTGY